MRWKTIKGYDFEYEISEDGRIRRGHRVHSVKTQKNGYLKAHLRKNGKLSCPLVHRLSYKAFIGPIPKGKEVNHIDGDKRNNWPSNLELTSRKGNINHAIEMGLIKRHGEESPVAKLKNKDVRIIRFCMGKVSNKLLAKCFGVSPSLIGLINQRKIWRKV